MTVRSAFWGAGEHLGKRVPAETEVGGDLGSLFNWERVPASVTQATFARADPSDRATFDAHDPRIRQDAAGLLRPIPADATLVGMIASFELAGDREVGSWADLAQPGQGIASSALRVLLKLDSTRPLPAWVAEHSLASAWVPGRAGFIEAVREHSQADGADREIVARTLVLNAGADAV